MEDMKGHNLFIEDAFSIFFKVLLLPDPRHLNSKAVLAD